MVFGIGSGALKVLAMDWGMNLPMKVSTTTSNFMIGVTAAISGSLYWFFGYMQPFMAMVSVLGITPGAYVVSRVLLRIRGLSIKVILLFATRMLLSGLDKGYILLIPMLIRHIIAFSVLIMSLVILWRLCNYLTE